jgi:adenylate cyclase
VDDFEAHFLRAKAAGATILSEIQEDSPGRQYIMFMDIVNFILISAMSTPNEMIHFLSELFSRFDELVEKHQAEKIETIGDSYMVTVGLPIRRNYHAQVTASLALDIQAYLKKGIAINGKTINCRIGINSGPVMAGVIERKKISYNVWGDTVNTPGAWNHKAAQGKYKYRKPLMS